MSTSKSMSNKFGQQKNLGPSSRTRSNKVPSGPASRTRSKPFTPFTKLKEDCQSTPSAAAGNLLKSGDSNLPRCNDDNTSRSLEQTFSCLDDRLLPDNFIDHLCLVRMNPVITIPQNNNAKEATDTEAFRNGIVEEKLLWPALQFDSLNELTNQINRSPLRDAATVCDMITSEYENLLLNAQTLTEDIMPSSFGVVYLLGRASMSLPTPLLILEKPWTGRLEVDGVNLFCFTDHYPEMADAIGKHCGSDEFQHALSVAIERTEKCLYSLKECVDVEYSDLARQKMNQGQQKMNKKS